MATVFPGALDSFTNPSTGNNLNSPSHAAQHDNINDAMAAVQAKLGITGSGVTSSHTYKLSGVTGSDKAASLAGSETLTNKILTTPQIAAIFVNGGANTATLFTSTDTVVGRATTDTLTNKTLTSAKVNQLNDTNGAVGLTITPTASAINGIVITNQTTGNAPIISPGGSGSDTNADVIIRGKGTGAVKVGFGAITIFPYDYIASGCIITADNVGVNKNYSISSGVVVINGKPLTFAGVSAQTVGASQDRYIDFSDNGDGTAAITNTEVANNSASPALSANNLRVGIVVAGATTIAATTSINQGQETRVLPISSSIPYAVTDSNGNLICPRDPQRKILGYRQITTAFTTSSTTDTQITGLAVPIIIPTGRKVKITLYSPEIQTTGSSGNPTASIYSGTVPSGTRLNYARWFSSISAQDFGCLVTWMGTLSGTVIINGGLSTSNNNGSVQATSTSPTFLMVELV